MLMKYAFQISSILDCLSPPLNCISRHCTSTPTTPSLLHQGYHITLFVSDSSLFRPRFLHLRNSSGKRWSFQILVYVPLLCLDDGSSDGYQSRHWRCRALTGETYYYCYESSDASRRNLLNPSNLKKTQRLIHWSSLMHLMSCFWARLFRSIVHSLPRGASNSSPS